MSLAKYILCIPLIYQGKEGVSGRMHLGGPPYPQLVNPVTEWGYTGDDLPFMSLASHWREHKRITASKGMVGSCSPISRDAVGGQLMEWWPCWDL